MPGQSTDSLGLLVPIQGRTENNATACQVSGPLMIMAMVASSTFSVSRHPPIMARSTRLRRHTMVTNAHESMHDGQNMCCFSLRATEGVLIVKVRCKGKNAAVMPVCTESSGARHLRIIGVVLERLNACGFWNE